MQIEDNRITNFVEFLKLNCGEVFKFKNNYYMKCEMKLGNKYAVNLCSGNIICISSETIVEIVNTKMVIEDNWKVSNNEN